MDQKQSSRPNHNRNFKQNHSRSYTRDPKQRLEALFTDPKQH